jgi:hypothetical protein
MAAVSKVFNFPRMCQYCSLADVRSRNCCDDDFHSSLVVVVECRKLESTKGRGNSYSERLYLYVADDTCPLFPITFYGQDAVHFASALNPGDIMIVEEFKVAIKTDDNGLYFSNGIANERTRTYRAFSAKSSEHSFPRQQFPVLYDKVESLIGWANDKYPFMYR